MTYETIIVLYTGLIIKNIFKYLRSRDYYFTDKTEYFVISLISISMSGLNLELHKPFISEICICLLSFTLLYFLDGDDFSLMYKLGLCLYFIRAQEVLVIGADKPLH